MCLTIPINALEIRFFFSTVHIIKWMLLSLALGISQKRREVMNFYNHFYDIVISLHNYHYIYLFIIIVVPIASLIKKITCFIQCSINSNIEISSILQRIDVPAIVCIDVILQYFTLYIFYMVHWITWTYVYQFYNVFIFIEVSIH